MEGHCRRIGPACRHPMPRPGVPKLFFSLSLLGHPRAPLQSAHSCLGLWGKSGRLEIDGRLLRIPPHVL
jgi:hypothetical protein